LSSRNLNTYRKRTLLSFARISCASIILVCIGHIAYGLDPNRSLDQYIHDEWGADKGFLGGPINAITQTPDGYLWIAIAKGLLRFDGLSFRYFQHSNTPELPAGPVLGLAVDPEGGLWIRSQGAGLLRYSGGRFENIANKFIGEESGVTAMANAGNGEIIVAGLLNGTLRYSGGKFLSLARPVPLPNFLMISLAEDSKGQVWMGTRDVGLYLMDHSGISAFSSGLPDQKINCLLPGSNEDLWIGTDSGVAHWDSRVMTNVTLDPTLGHIQILSMIRDHDGNVWLGTSSGIFRITAQGDVTVPAKSSSAAKVVTSLFEDREGNVWVGTYDRLERMRDSVFLTYSVATGMPSDNHGPIYVDGQNRVWFGPTTGGLYWSKGGQVERVTTAGLGADVVYSISGTGDELWIGRQRGGLTHLRYSGATYTSETYSTTQGLAQNSVFAVQRARDGTVWAGTLSGGVSHLSGGKFATFTDQNLASNTIKATLESSDGTMWFATPNGVSSLSQTHWQTFVTKDGLPSERVNCLLEDAAGVVWAGTDAGLAFFRAGRFVVPEREPSILNEQILGLVEDKIGSFWISSSNHVLRVSRAALMSGQVSEETLHEYGPADGLKSTEGVKRYQSVTTDSLGTIWLSLNSGLSVVNPNRSARSAASTPVHIVGLMADGTSWELGNDIRIPSSRRRISFSFVGLNLAMPHRVKFRYKLDNLESNWSEPIGAGEAIYSNLGPGRYRFHVMASNGDGLWNSTEDTVAFEILPVFWQTWWFRLVALIVLISTALTLYRLRLYQLTKQLNLRFEERLAERTLIAQDLHDTLLQGFLSASMQLDVAVDNLPADFPGTPRFLKVLDLMRTVIDEGRNALRGLRSATTTHSLNLEEAFARLKLELGAGDEVGFRVIAEGPSRPVNAIVRDEVYRIGREAVVNAFRHSHGKVIEVEVAYLGNHLRVRVRDDGLGIDAAILEFGRDGHWGLSGMRERAESIGAQLKVRSKVGAGTEVELTVPNSVAFPEQSSDRIWRRLKLFPWSRSGNREKGQHHE
jgi:ligand-binding sensor domain-containing protein/signal transduction histidine kinase